MLTAALLTLATLLFTFFAAFLSAIIPSYTTVVSLGSYVGYVFGNLYLFNDFLPITETLAMAGLALSFKGALLFYKVTMTFFHLLNFIRRTFVSFRV